MLLFFRELSLVYLLKCGIIKSWTRWSPRYSGKQSKPGKPQLTVILLLLIIVLKNGSLADKWEQVCFYFSQKDIQNQGKKIHIVNYVDSQCSCSQKPAIPTDIMRDEWIKTLNNHLIPTPFKIVWCFKCNTKVHKSGESGIIYIAKLTIWCTV